MTDLPPINEEQAREALRGHVVDRALLAREKYGPDFDLETMRLLLADTDVVRYPTRLEFSDRALQPGEFAQPEPAGVHPAEGFVLFVHPYFKNLPLAIPPLVAYHIPSINYGNAVTSNESELYGATLLELEVEVYYALVCRLADSIPEMSV